MKFKIQIWCGRVAGIGDLWADMKASIDGAPRTVCLFETKADAENEVFEMCHEGGSVAEELQIVTEDIAPNHEL